MIVSATAQPSLNEISSFVSKVRIFPVSVGQLIKMAHDVGASPRIVNFYKKFAPYRVFENKDELAVISEQVDLMRREEAEMPQDGLAIPQED